MRIGDGIRLIQEYWNSCTDDLMLKSARDDHRQHLNDIIKKGYSWGLGHQLPFDGTSFGKNEIKTIYSILFHRQRKGPARKQHLTQ